MRSHRAEVSAASGCAKALLLGALLVGLTFIRERFFVVRERFKVTTDPAGPGRRIVDRPYDGRGDRSTAEPGWFDAGDHGGPRSAPGHLVPDPRRARTAGTSAPRARSRRGREPVAVERRARHHGHTTATTRSHSARLTRPTRPRPMQQSHPTHRWRAGWRSPLRTVRAAGRCARFAGATSTSSTPPLGLNGPSAPPVPQGSSSRPPRLIDPASSRSPNALSTSSLAVTRH